MLCKKLYTSKEDYNCCSANITSRVNAEIRPIEYLLIVSYQYDPGEKCRFNFHGRKQFVHFHIEISRFEVTQGIPHSRK